MGADTQEEIWKDVVGYEQYYQISSHGKLRSVRRGRIMSAPPNSSGYHHTSLNAKGSTKGIYIHLIVAGHFVDNPFSKPEINHKDGDKSNNKCNNLEWVTKCENMRHSYHVLRRGHIKLTPQDVMAIRESYASGNGVGIISDVTGVSRANIQAIVTRQSWKHI